MKKIVLMLLSIALVFTFTACGIAPEKESEETTKAVNGGPNTVLGGGTLVPHEEYAHSGNVDGGNYPKGDEPVSWFDAKVLSVSGNTILVEPHEDSWERQRCADQIYVTTKLYNGEVRTGFDVGDEVCIVFNGMIAESYPAQIFTVYDIAFKTTPDVPSDFAFSMKWGVFGISSYDSKTGKLVKTTDATHPEDYVAECFLTDEQLATVFGIISELDIESLGEFDYDDFGLSDPHLSLSLTVKMGNIDKTINVPEASLMYEGKTPEAQKFINAVKAIRDILVNTDEWKALPDYEAYYE